MRLDAESLVVPVLVALYLKDSLLMLGRDEALLVRGWRGRWRAVFGPRDWQLRGRSPVLLNPFTPHHAVLRLRRGAGGGGPARHPAKLPAALQALVPSVVVIWLLLFVGLPVALYAHLGLRVLLALVVAIYLLAAAAVAFVWRHREALGLDRGATGVLAVEVLFCAPYAANLLRRISLMRPVDEDLLAVSRRLLAGASLVAMREATRRRIEDELDWLDDASPRAQALLREKKELDDAHE